KWRRFQPQDEAQTLASSLAPQILLRTAGPVIAPPSAPMGDGIYPYETAAGQRWRFVFRQSDGSLTTRRGFTTRAGAAAGRRAAVEAVRRGESKISRETFGDFWARFLADRRPYVTPGTI